MMRILKPRNNTSNTQMNRKKDKWNRKKKETHIKWDRPLTFTYEWFDLVSSFLVPTTTGIAFAIPSAARTRRSYAYINHFHPHAIKCMHSHFSPPPHKSSYAFLCLSPNLTSILWSIGDRQRDLQLIDFDRNIETNQRTGILVLQFPWDISWVVLSNKQIKDVYGAGQW